MDRCTTDGPVGRAQTSSLRRSVDTTDSANDGASSQESSSYMKTTMRPAPQLVSNNSSHEVQLSRLVELEIIPRLMLLHRPAQPAASARPAHQVVLTVQHVDALARLAVDGDSSSAASYVRALFDAGATPEQVFVDLLAPAARMLGTKWEADAYDFSQVTIGLWRLQKILYEESRSGERAQTAGQDAQRALMTAVPGAQHTFGAAMAAEFFLRAGWDVHYEIGASWAGLKAAVSANWFDIVGFSVNTDADVQAVASAILDIRRVSANPYTFVMVGGAATRFVPDLTGRIGADYVAEDAPSALAFANQRAANGACRRA